MIRTVALLGLVAAASGFWDNSKLWEAGLSSRFDANFLTWGSESFIALPRNSTAAKEMGWTIGTRPARSVSSGYDDLVMWVNPSNYIVSILVDENNKTSGLQLAVPSNGLDSYYDMEELGFTYWTYVNASGVTENSWTKCIYFASEDKETRIASYNETQLLPESNIALDGLTDELVYAATNVSNIDSNWTKEACIIFMGRHYFYNMTETLDCSKPFVSWFLLYSDNTKQLIGAGLYLITKSFNSTYFESPTTDNVKLILENRPDCMTDLVNNYVVRTLHIYFIDQPWLITC